VNTRVLVTGATGFLGRNVLAALAARGDVTPIAACRTPSTLDPGFRGEVRVGDLRDPDYRRRVVRDVDVVCHAGTWGSLWGHREAERTHFFEPARDLIDQAIDAGAERFLLASTLVVGVPDDGLGVRGPTGFWPHLDRLLELETYLRDNSHRGTRMISMRLGHFVGAGNRLGLVAALAPRLRTRLVPWLSGGRARLALVADSDLGEAFALASVTNGLSDHEVFTICGPDFPTAREVITFIGEETGLPLPRYSVPYPAGYAFGWLMERLHRVLPGEAPFLTRSLVYLAEDWQVPTDHTTNKLGYRPRKDWRTATRESLAELTDAGLPWLPLAQEA
jgi:nucleoside-diphosphate-sugar epimerase